MYVSQPLRYVENDIDSLRKKLVKVNEDNICDEVYTKSEANRKTD
jgi:hypothetical protein